MEQYSSKPGPSCGIKRKQPDKDELLTDKPPIENEYEHIEDDDDDEEDDDDDETVREKRKAEHEQTLEALRSQERETILHDDDIKITPFNVNEELEEGEFDKSGNFIFRKGSPTDDDNIDNWADSVDWKAVEKKEREGAKTEPTKIPVEADDTEPTLDKLSCYKQMLRIMRPDETVQKTIRRLGDKVPKRRFGKTKTTMSGDVAEAKVKLDRMIELAHQRIEDGDTDIYQRTYEFLEDAIN